MRLAVALFLAGCASSEPKIEAPVADSAIAIDSARADAGTDLGFCYADFPCGGGGGAWQCDGDGSAATKLETNDCSYRCGEVPCSGASCDPTGPRVVCAAGTRCVPGAAEPCTALDAGTDASDVAVSATCSADALPTEGTPCSEPSDYAYCRLKSCGFGCEAECACRMGKWKCTTACRDDYGCGTPPSCRDAPCP